MEVSIPPSEKPKRRRQGSVWSSVYSFLASPRFCLLLLLIIGCLSFLGMLIVQNAPVEQYDLRYGKPWGGFIRATGLGSIFQSWWYLLLLLLLALNLVLCSLKRLRLSISQAFRGPVAEDNEMLRGARSVNVDAEAGDVSRRIEDGLRRKRFAVRSKVSGSHGLLAGQKGGISRMGFLVTHIAVILVLVAGAVNGQWGVRIQRPVSIGEFLEVREIEPSADFRIRVDDFVIETTDEGKISDFKSTLTVVRNGKDFLTKVIQVNQPLRYEGVSFYQSSYGQEPDRIREARILFVENESSDYLVVDVPFGEQVPVYGTDMTVSVTEYVPHFVKDLSTGMVRSRSREPRLPAVKLDIFRDQRPVDSGWLIMGMDVHSGTGELSRFHFADYYPLFYTGIDMAKNPGVSLLFTGFGIASIGIFLSFFVSWRRIWVKISRVAPGRCELRVAGVSRKDPLLLKQDIEDLYGLVQRRQNFH
jgi:cytochrome c biogenesis protein